MIYSQFLLMLPLIQQTSFLALWYKTKGISLVEKELYRTEFSHLHSFNQTSFTT